MVENEEELMAQSPIDYEGIEENTLIRATCNSSKERIDNLSELERAALLAWVESPDFEKELFRGMAVGSIRRDRNTNDR